MSILSNIVGRCHVSDSNRTVIKYFLSRVNKEKWDSFSKQEKRKWLLEVVEEHHRNRQLYFDVMRGNI